MILKVVFVYNTEVFPQKCRSNSVYQSSFLDNSYLTLFRAVPTSACPSLVFPRREVSLDDSSANSQGTTVFTRRSRSTGLFMYVLLHLWAMDEVWCAVGAAFRGGLWK